MSVSGTYFPPYTPPYRPFASGRFNSFVNTRSGGVITALVVVVVFLVFVVVVFVVVDVFLLDVCLVVPTTPTLARADSSKDDGIITT
jgi:hypothetical protein